VGCGDHCHPHHRRHRGVQLSRHSNGIKSARHNFRPIDAGAGIATARIRATGFDSTGRAFHSGGSGATPLETARLEQFSHSDLSNMVVPG
jgi:hypothetical protein